LRVDFLPRCADGADVIQRPACWLLAAAVSLGFVLPVDRVMQELSRLRRDLPPIQVEAVLAGIGSGWPEHVVLDVHPELGLRVRSDEPGRWLIRSGRLVAGASQRIPIWVPPIEILTLRKTESIHAWLDAFSVDRSANRLARCGDADCFVIGSPRSPGQVWLDKDRFEVIRVVLPEGRRVEFAQYRDWAGIRFPSKIEILDEHGALATLVLEGVSRAAISKADEFSPRWVNAVGSPHRH
jgi:hypothetical protein